MGRIKNKGFTLIESIVTIVILSVVAFSVMHILVEGFRVWSENIGLIALRANGRVALDRLALEFREAEAVNLQDAHTVLFEADIFGDGRRRQIVYALSNGNLTRSVINEPPVRTICGEVSALTFSWNTPVLTIDMSLTRGDDTVNINMDVMARCLP